AYTFKYISHKPTPSQPQNNKEMIRVRVHGASWVGDEPEKLLVETDPRKTIQEEKLPSIKQAIEAILNEIEFHHIPTFKFETVKYPRYDQQDLEKAFTASRERNITGDRHDDKGHPFYKYRKFEEYLKSKV